MFAHAYDFYFVDLNIIYQIFSKNIWYIFKIFVVAYAAFYWLPTLIFPQEHTGNGVQKIVFNFVYMVAYIEVVVTFLIFIKIFSLIIFIFVLIATKLAFLKWYYKKNISLYLNRLRVSFMLWSLDVLENPKKLKIWAWEFFKKKVLDFQKSLTIYNLFQKILFFSVFAYIISILIARGLYSYSDPVADTSQFIEWVDFLQRNMLYPVQKTFGADFYGMSIMVFFINILTNIDQIALFSLYPILVLMALYFSIYYIIKDFSGSKYVALFAVIVHGVILMSPVSNFFLGKTIITSYPQLIDIFGLKFYMPTAADISRGFNNGYVPYIRYISGMAYEHSSIFVLLNSYFLIKIFRTKLDRFFVLYALTLMLVFTFHGGGAIVLVFISIAITINAILFRKIDFATLKRGSLLIFVAAIIGNMWMLSMIRYGIPQNFGAAAPILDKILNTKRNIQENVAVGFSIVSIVNITKLHLAMVAMAIFGYIISIFTQKKFINSSLMLIVLSIFFIYFEQNLGLPLLTKQSRLAEYVFFAITILFSFYFYFLFYKPIFAFFKRFSRVTILALTYSVFLGLVLTLPTWVDTKQFWKNINELEYTSIPDIILEINKKEKPFSWTVVSYVQEYAKVKNKGYHLNTQNFLLRYDPKAKYLKVPTPKIYIFVENFTNPYRGMDEWYYRWRDKIQNSLKSWVAIYSLTHKNIKIFKKTKTVTVYEIDNTDYMKYLVNQSKKRKRSK